jgi:hypothetical protein
VKGHDRYFTLEMSALLMNSGRMDVKCLFPVSAHDNHWEMSGMVGSIDMAAFNRALVPSVNIKVTSGEMQSLVFHLIGTNEQSHIHLTMAYTDLLVEVLKRDEHTERKFLTFLADDIFIRHSNPGNNGKLRSGEGHHNRDPYRSMYNYMWRSFVPAIVKTVI